MAYLCFIDIIKVKAQAVKTELVTVFTDVRLQVQMCFPVIYIAKAEIIIVVGILDDCSVKQDMLFNFTAFCCNPHSIQHTVV